MNVVKDSANHSALFCFCLSAKRDDWLQNVNKLVNKQCLLCFLRVVSSWLLWLILLKHGLDVSIVKSMF